MNPENALPAAGNDAEVEIDLLDLGRHLLRKLKLLTIAGGIGLALSLIYVFIIATPVYEATAQLYVVNSKDSAVNLSDLQIGTYLTSDYQLVFNTWEVNQQVKDNLNLPYTVPQLREMVSVTNPSNTRVLFITVSRNDPVEAATIANEFSEVAKRYIYDTMLSEMPSTLSVAQVPTEPVRPRKALCILATTLLCVLACAAALTVRYLLDDKIKTASDLEKYTGLPPLAIIPLTNTGTSRGRRRSGNRERRPR